MSRSYAQQCPIARTLDLVGDRWTLLVVRDLFLGYTKFKEFLEHSPGMPTRMLSERLKALEANGLVGRRVYSHHPLRAEYHLTERGRSLRPVVEAVVTWGLEHTLEPRERAAVIEMINDRLGDGTIA
jgi:DNA-binding HxlR family transcriptional regulator